MNQHAECCTWRISLPPALSIDGLRLLERSPITFVNFTSDKYEMRKIHEEMHARGWGHGYGRIRGVERIRLSIHPQRDRTHAEKFLNALQDSVSAVRSQT